jgi:hypothetical protein
MDRAFGFGPKGWGFKSLRAYKKIPLLEAGFLFGGNAVTGDYLMRTIFLTSTSCPVVRR